MDKEEPSVQEWIERLRAGDSEARDVLLCKYLPHLERVLTHQMRTMGIQLTCDVHDLCQSTARRFLGRGEQFQFASADAFFAYLLRTGKHLVEQRAREEATARARQMELDESQWSEIEDPAAEPARRVSACEQWQAIACNLEADERVLLESRVLGQRWRVIGVSLGSSAGAVRQRARRLMDRLRRTPR